MTPVAPRVPGSWTSCRRLRSPPRRHWSPATSSAATATAPVAGCASVAVAVAPLETPHLTFYRQAVAVSDGGRRQNCLTATSSCPAGRSSCSTSRRSDRPSACGPAAWSFPRPPVPAAATSPAAAATPPAHPRHPLPHHSAADVTAGTDPPRWSAAARLTAALRHRRRGPCHRIAAHRGSPRHRPPPGGVATPRSEFIPNIAPGCPGRPVSRWGNSSRRDDALYGHEPGSWSAIQQLNYKCSDMPSDNKRSSISQSEHIRTLHTHHTG